MHVLAKRWISLTAACAVMAGMCFGGIGTMTVSAAETESVEENPAIIITGSDVLGGNQYTEDNIGKEVIYTLDELKAIAAKDQAAEKTADNRYLYSAINTRDTKSIYKAEGVRVQALFDDAGVKAEGDVSFTAEDGYKTVFDADQAEPGTIDKPSPTMGFQKERYYFPNFMNQTETEKDAAVVPTIIAWAEGGNKGETTVPDKLEPYGLEYVRAITGQLNPSDYNNPIWNGDSGYLAITLGDSVGEDAGISIDGKSYTRLQMLGRESVTSAYTYEKSSGITTEYAKGVPVEEFLTMYDDNDLVTLIPADDPKYQVQLTKKELVDGNYILAYEKGDTADSMERIYETAKNDANIKGYFTLYGDGAKPAKMIHKITVEDVAEPTPEDPNQKVIDGVQATTIDNLKVTAKAGANDISFVKSQGYKVDEYQIYRSRTGKTGSFGLNKAVKTTKYTDKISLTAGKKYYYKVRGVRTIDGKKYYTQWSDVQSVTAKAAVNPIKAGVEKTTLKAKTAAAKGKMTVSWTKSAGYKVDSYQIYRSRTGKTGSFGLVKSGVKTTKYTDSTVKKGKKYYYKVRGVRKVDGKTVYTKWSNTAYRVAK